jgi:hypothetical protein
MIRWQYLAVLFLTACGGSEISAAASSPRPLSAQASDAREADPTAAAPPPSGASLKLAGESAPPAAASAPAAPLDPANPPKRIGARHVLIQWMGSEKAPPSVVRTRDQALEVAKEVLRRARAGEDVGRLAVEYSDEPGAGNRGGSLGRFGRGQMVPAFEEAAFHLKVNQISDIVETPFGYHIIQRTE